METNELLEMAEKMPDAVRSRANRSIVNKYLPVMGVLKSKGYTNSQIEKFFDEHAPDCGSTTIISVFYKRKMHIKK